MAIDVPKDEKAVAVAEESRALARTAAQIHELALKILEPLASVDGELLEAPTAAEAAARGPRLEAWLDEKGRELAPFFAAGIASAELAAWAVETIRVADDEVMRIERYTEALRVRAIRRAAWVHDVLWPAVRAWAERNRPAKGRTLKLPATERRLQFKKVPERLEITDERAAKASVEAEIGYGAMLEGGFIVVREEIRKKAFYEHAKAAGKPVPGIERVEEHEELYVL